MNGGWLRYKCRMCGEEYQNLHVPDLLLALSSLIVGEKGYFVGLGGLIPSLLDTHFHTDDSQGVADLVGGVNDSPARETETHHLMSELEYRASQPCECHLPAAERKFEQDPFDETCVPCWARQTLREADDFIEQFEQLVDT